MKSEWRPVREVRETAREAREMARKARKTPENEGLGKCQRRRRSLNGGGEVNDRGNQTAKERKVEKAEEKKKPYGPWLMVTYGRNINGQERYGAKNVGGEGSTTNKTTKNNGFRFNVLEEQPSEEMKTEFTDCLGVKYKTDALKDVTNVAGRGGIIGKSATASPRVGRGRRSCAGRAQIPKSSKTLKRKTCKEGGVRYDGGKLHNNFQKIMYKKIDSEGTKQEMEEARTLQQFHKDVLKFKGLQKKDIHSDCKNAETSEPQSGKQEPGAGSKSVQKQALIMLDEKQLDVKAM
ncbi:hypothetical protein ACOSQ4_028789 [Xanthoceras sorbifolium]